MVAVSWASVLWAVAPALSFAEDLKDESDLIAVMRAAGIEVGTSTHVNPNPPTVIRRVTETGEPRDWRKDFKIMTVLWVSLELADFRGEIKRGRAELKGTPALEAIKTCRYLHGIDLGNSDIDSSDIVDLPTLPSLSSLRLENTNVDDQLLKKLRGHAKLEVLLLSGTLVTEVGLRKVSEITELETLSAGGPLITGSFFENIVDARNLRLLSIDSGHINPKYLPHLAALPLKTLTIACKPSQLPVAELAKSSVREILVVWDHELDQSDKFVIEALTSEEPVRYVLVVDSQ